MAGAKCGWRISNIFRSFVSNILLYLLLPAPSGHAFTHWCVEDGLIKYQEGSLYTLHTPSDLTLFIAQSKAADELRKLERQSKELMRQQNLLRAVETERIDRERLAFYSDPDCRITQKKLSQFDLYLSSFLRLEAKNIKIEDYVDYTTDLPGSLTTPVCKSEFLFSMSSYDHLKGVADRKNLVNVSEIGLLNPIPQAKNLEEFGHRINVALHHNATSWVLLNFAAIYWRVAGNAYNAVECLRRALHYSPRQHKDLALVSLANILHRSKYSLDAAILIHAAIETTSDYDIVYFTLGNIYGALGQFDLADICYKYVADLQPAFEAARLRMHAAKCEYKLGSYVDGDQNSLQKQIDELEVLMVKQQIIEDQHKEGLSERSSPLQKYDIYTDIQPPHYERGG